MKKIEINWLDEEIPERKEPEDGWKKPCIIADHKWALKIEEGRAYLECVDPHLESFINEVDPQYGPPVCLERYWEHEDLGTVEAIPVKVTHVADSISAGPWGTEYGFYIEIEAPDA